MARKRLSRRQLVEKDEITASLVTASEFIYARRRQLIYGTVAIGVAIIGIVGWNLYAGSREARAQGQLASVVRVFSDTTAFDSDQERYEGTLAEVRTFDESYRSLRAGQIVRYYEALSHAGLGDRDQAVRILEKLVAEGDDAGVNGIAGFALASLYRLDGRIKKSVESYEHLLEGQSYSSSAVLLELARLYEDLGQPDEARSYYQQVVDGFADSPLKEEADRALKRLGPGSRPAVEEKP